MSKLSINESTLTAIGDAIREKTGKTGLIAPGAMPNEIKGIQTGDVDLPEEALVITGLCHYRFAYNSWNWYLETYKGYLSTNNITTLNSAFWETTNLQEIPFDINCDPNRVCDMNNMFSRSGIKSVPMIRNAKSGNMFSMFDGCQNIVYFPEGFGEDWDWSNADAGTGPYSGVQTYGMFKNCYKLRQLPMALLAHANPYASAAYTTLKELAWKCKSLDEIIDLPNPHTKGTYAETSEYNNICSRMVAGCARLKNFTFAEMDPVNWASQVLDFSDATGWETDSYSNIVNNDPNDTREGLITADKEVKDDATYQALKDDPDWWTKNVAYSRYNHDSAVRTINSLPSAIEYQTSSGKGANIIKFKGEAGSLTDGGAINTLTEEEIAVAAAKGWTVSLV
jgi:uncharacterized protein YceK